MCCALCSLVGLWSLCEMSTGVNEYPLWQSPGNPHNKMHNSLIKSATVPGGRPLAFSSQPHRDFSRFDAQSCQSFISLYTFFFLKTALKLVAVIIWDLLAAVVVATMDPPASCLRQPHRSLPARWLCVSFLSFFFFFNQRSIVSLALFFFHTLFASHLLQGVNK